MISRRDSEDNACLLNLFDSWMMNYVQLAGKACVTLIFRRPRRFGRIFTTPVTSVDDNSAEFKFL